MPRRYPVRKFRLSCHAGSIEPLENRLLMSAVRSADGTGNNLGHSAWGSAGADLIRLAKPAYADSVSSPALPSDESAREVSNILNSQADPDNPAADIATVDQNSLSDFGYSFGQFMDHDMDLTPTGTESFPIPVGPTDPIGPLPIDFTRSVYDPSTGTGPKNPRQQVTKVTSYLDLSQVYGSNQTVADALRTMSNGLLKTSPGNMLPYDNSQYFTPAQITALNMANDAGVLMEGQLFATGDVRGNENVELTVLQTLFMRNHNRIATELKKENPGWTDEQLYQEARKLNIAEYENIIYTQWIPAVFGKDALPAYQGYNKTVNATIANEFSTVAFRFGHSLLSADIARQTNSGADINDPAGADISLATDFFDSNMLNPAGVVDPLTGQTSTDIDPILKGDADGNAQAMDTMAIGDVRNLLFGNGAGGDDLMARDVQRARDNGIPDYNTLRVAMGLPAVTSFAQITSNVKVQQELAAAYPGGVNTIDAFEGGLAEDHVAGSDVGPLFQAIIVNQFTRLRDGDRFFYLNESFNRQEMNTLSQDQTLAQVIESNTHITNLQSDVFFFRASIDGTLTAAPNNWRSIGLPGITVDLEDAAGDVLATTTTDAHGHYSFDQLSGPASALDLTPGLSATGTYTIVPVLPKGMTQASPYPHPIVITRGDTSVHGIDFSICLPANALPPHAPLPSWSWDSCSDKRDAAGNDDWFFTPGRADRVFQGML